MLSLIKKLALLVIISSLPLSFSSSANTTEIFTKIPKKYSILKKVLDNPNYRVQIIYTQINRDKENNPSFNNFSFGVDEHSYFYPASTVKLPVAALALEWLNEQNNPLLTRDTPLIIEAARPSQTAAKQDITAPNLLPSIGHYIKKIAIVSDNDAYNRLYELLGQDYINSKMRQKGMPNTVINHRLEVAIDAEENRYVNPLYFLDNQNNIIFNIPQRYSEKQYFNLNHPTIGLGYYKNNDYIPQPMDFTYKNKLALTDLHGVIERIVFPKNFPVEQQFLLTPEDRHFLLKYMSMLPKESDYPSYPQPEYYDSYSKFIRFGGSKKPIPSSIRLFNKTGDAYGHLLDAGYFVDFNKNIEFILSAVIYVNKDNILNDDKYEYNEIGFPFFAELGDFIYNIELKRKKEIIADLSEFKKL